MKAFKIIFVLIFLLFSFFQLNDPDSGVWIVAYMIPALACFASIRGLKPEWFFYGLAVVYITGSVLQWPPEFEGIFFGETKMRSLNIELARESLGLCIVSLVMVVIGKWG